jgi:hypothetical protein
VSKTQFKLPLETASVDSSNLLPALDAVRGFLKTTSMLWMHALGLSVLPGVIVSDWSKDSALAVNRFCRRGQFSNLLLRIDKRHERWTRRRGGYLLSLRDVPALVRELRPEGMIAALLEPASPYADRYSLAGVTVPNLERMIVEVVGPGFDASDILRGDLPAHERWEIDLAPTMSSHQVNEYISSRQVHLTTREQYSESVRMRLAKIGARVKDAAFPDTVLKTGATNSAELVAHGTAFLKRTRQLTLLKHADIYCPIPGKDLALFSRSVAKLLAGLSSYGIDLGPTSFAASFIPKRGLIFWDFFPSRKEDAAFLYPAGGPG